MNNWGVARSCSGECPLCCLLAFRLLLFLPIFGKPVNRRQFMRRRKVRIANGHLDVLVTGKLLHGSQIDSGHHEARDVRVPEDVPGNVQQGTVLRHP